MEAASTQDTEALYRAAVGARKADFYIPKFIGFDQPGASRLSWNWPAFSGSTVDSLSREEDDEN